MTYQPGITILRPGHESHRLHEERIQTEAELIQRSTENPTTTYVRVFPGSAPEYFRNGINIPLDNAEDEVGIAPVYLFPAS